MDVDPCPARGCTYSANLGQGGVFRAWNSGAYAEDFGPDGAMIYQGGGDADYWGNETYAFPLDTKVWERLNDPSEVGPNFTQIEDPIECEHADGRPGATHSYDAYEVLNASEGGGLKGMMLTLKSTAVKTTNATGRAHFVDLDTGLTGRFSINRATYGSNHIPSVCKDTLRNRFWMYYKGNAASIWSMDFTAREWIKAGNLTTSPWPGVYPVSDYYPHGDLMVSCCVVGVENAPALLATKLYAPSAPRVVLPLSGDTISWDGKGTGFCYAPPLNAFFVRDFNKPGEMLRIDAPDPSQDPLTTPWNVTRISIPGSPAGLSAGNYKRMRWTKNNGFVWCDGRDLPVYSYQPGIGLMSLNVPSGLIVEVV